jgi:tripartite-type tricarboxylate transporter receptor subunit TctC
MARTPIHPGEHLAGAIMKLPRRKFLHLAAGAAALPAISRSVQADTYPSRPLHCLVGYAPGGGTDIFVRQVGQMLPARLGQPFVIENRPGASSNLATEAVVRAPPDGYTLLGTDGAAAINATLYDNLSFNFVRDIAIVAMSRGPLVVALHPSVPAKTMAEFIAYLKANPGKVTMASAGTGSTNQLAGELFKAMAGVDMTHVPYRGAGPAVADLLGGQVQVMFTGLPPSIGHIRSGGLHALAVTTATRFEGLPDLPPVADFVPGYETSQWWALGLRKSTPAEIIERLNKEMNAILADAQIKARMADLGGAPFPGSPADFASFLADETAKWGKAVRLSGAKPE